MSHDQLKQKANYIFKLDGLKNIFQQLNALTSYPEALCKFSYNFFFANLFRRDFALSLETEDIVT